MSNANNKKFPWRPPVAALVVVAVIVALRTLPVGEWLETFNAWVAGLGAWGFVVFVAVYVIAAVLFLPGSALTLGAGFIFGIGLGLAAVSLGSTLGAASAFLISRHLARDAVSARFGGNEKFASVDRAVGREGARIVFLMRLSPVFPFNVLNYLLGLTSIRFWPYVLASWAGMLPGTLLYVYLGYIGRAAAEAAAGGAGAADGGALRYVYLGVGLLATLGVTIYVTRLARRALRETSAN